MSDRKQEDLLFEYFELTGDDPGFGEIAAIWGNFAKLAGNEMKRVVRAASLVAQVNLNPFLKTKAQYDKMFQKYNESMKKINTDTDKIMGNLCKGDACREAEYVMFLANPGLFVASSIRDAMGSVTPEKVEAFMDDTGLGTVPILGGATTWAAKKATAAGQFAALTGPVYVGDPDDPEGGDQIKDIKRGLIDRLYGIFLLQNPLKNEAAFDRAVMQTLHRHAAFEMLLEQEEKEGEESGGQPKDEFDDFVTLMVALGVNEDVDKGLGNDFVKAHREFSEELVAQLELDVAEAIAIANADKLEDFIKAVKEGKSEQLQGIDENALMQEIEESVNGIIADEETLAQYLEAAGKKPGDFGVEMPEAEEGEEKPEVDKAALAQNEKLRQFLAQAIYDQNLAGERSKIFEGLGEIFKSAWDEILVGLEEDEMESLKGTLTGDQIYETMQNSLQKMLTSFNQLNAV